MTQENAPTPIYTRPAFAFAALGLGAAILLAGVFLDMLPSVTEREIRSSCAAMRPSPTNQALGTLPAAVPQFTAQDQSGQMVSMADFKGKYTLVNFWASWCGVCALEKPTLAKLEEDMGDRLEIVTLASDEDWEEIKEIYPQGPPFRVLLDPPGDNGNIGRVARTFGVTAVPESFLVDPDGVVRHYFINRRNWASSVAQTCLKSIIDDRSGSLGTI